jgi:murein DD-endopeptidase MepM/ murein hydrolase activator NlpD
MLKFIVFVSILYELLASNNNLDKKISLNKTILQQEQKHKNKTNKEIKKLASEINTEEKKLDTINVKLLNISNLIALNKLKLNSSIKKIKKLELKSEKLKKTSAQTEKNIVNSIIQKYSISLSKKLISKESIKDIINKEKYDIILDNTKNKILKSNIQYFQIQNKKKENYTKINNLKLYIKKQKKQKNRYDILKSKQNKSINNLKNKYKEYKNILKNIINKQNQINNLLGNLNILKIKKDKIKKDKIKRKKLKEALKRQLAKKKMIEQKEKKKKRKYVKIRSNSKIINESNSIKIRSRQALEEEVDLDVKKYGSSLNGIKVSKYRGNKTIAPLASYIIVKKFGKYYDPIYKIELFNESISLKSKVKNAKVHSILKGKVIYSKNNAGTLGSVVIVKHSRGLHTVYSQLSNIPKSLRVGKWIPEGYVVGRVKDILIFQATKNNRYINPIKLFKR